MNVIDKDDEQKRSKTAALRSTISYVKFLRFFNVVGTGGNFSCQASNSQTSHVIPLVFHIYLVSLVIFDGQACQMPSEGREIH